MNNILKSNPFLFCAGTPTNSQEEEDLKKTNDEFIKYQKKEFEEAWKSSLEINETKSPLSNNSSALSDSEEDSSLSSLPPTTISLKKTLSITDLLDSSMEDLNNWASQGGLDLYSVLPDLNDSQEEQSAFVDNIFGEGKFLEDLYDLDLDKELGGEEEDKKKVTDDKMFSSAGQNTIPSFKASFSPVEQSQPQIVAPTVMTFETTINNNNMESVVAETSNRGNNTNTRGGHQRKASLGQRMIAASPYNCGEQEQQDVKPDVPALGINNGQDRIIRKRSGSFANVDSPSSSNAQSSSSSKRPRKYEIDDASDPSVRNAKAAKLNRERKKQEFNEMKKRAEAAENKVNTMTTQLNDAEQKAKTFEELYNAEKSKNMTAQGINNSLTNMKHIFEAVIPALSQKFGKNMAVEVPDAFATIPATVDSNGIATVGFGQQPSTINQHDLTSMDLMSNGSYILPQDSLMDDQSMSNQYVTLHINPVAGKIKLDYDPRKLFPSSQNNNNNEKDMDLD